MNNDDENKQEQKEIEQIEEDVRKTYNAIFDPRVIQKAFKKKDAEILNQPVINDVLDDLNTLDIELTEIKRRQRIIARLQEQNGMDLSFMSQETIDALAEYDYAADEALKSVGSLKDWDGKQQAIKEMERRTGLSVSKDGALSDEMTDLMLEQFKQLDNDRLEMKWGSELKDTPINNIDDMIKLLNEDKIELEKNFKETDFSKLSKEELKTNFGIVKSKDGYYYEKEGRYVKMREDFHQDIESFGETKSYLEETTGETKVLEDYEPNESEIQEMKDFFGESNGLMVEDAATREGASVNDLFKEMIEEGRLSKPVAAKLTEQMKGFENISRDGVKISMSDGKISFDFGSGEILEGDLFTEGSAEGLTQIAQLSGKYKAGELMGRLAAFAETYSAELALAGRAISIASNVAGVIGMGILIYDIGNTIYTGVENQKKYSEAADQYIQSFGEVAKMNRTLKESYNKQADQNNKFTRMYHKYVINKKNPNNAGAGVLMPKFEYKSDFKSLINWSDFNKKDGYQNGRQKIYGRIADYMLKGLTDKQENELQKTDVLSRGALREKYAKENESRKNNIYEGLKRVDLGKENTKYSWLDDIWLPIAQAFSADDTMSMRYEDETRNKQEELQGRAKLKAIYDAIRETEMRQKFMKTQYGLNRKDLTEEAIQERRFLNTNDNQLIRHYEQQTKSDPAFKRALRARTQQLNQNRSYVINQTYLQAKSKLNAKWLQLEREMPMFKKSYEVIRLQQWKKIDRSQQKDLQKHLLSDNTVMNGMAKYSAMSSDREVNQMKPYWLLFRQKNYTKYFLEDTNEILKNQKAWIKRGRRAMDEEKTYEEPPDYGPGFIRPKIDIQRTLRHKKPVIPVVPLQPIPKPNKPKPFPLPKPLPKPEKKPTKNIPRILGINDNHDLQPSYENAFDEDYEFDLNMAMLLLKCCESSYKSFEEEGYVDDERFHFDETITFGSENMFESSQGRMYYSIKDDVIIIAYRGTDFAKATQSGRGVGLALSDIYNDLNVQHQKYEGLNMHKGFLKYYEETEQQVLNFINERFTESTTIYTTGHSLGAPPSVLLTWKLNLHYNAEVAINYNFGSPKGFDEKSAKIINSSITSFRIAEIDDPICQLPPDDWNYFHTGIGVVLNDHKMDFYYDLDKADSYFNETSYYNMMMNLSFMNYHSLEKYKEFLTQQLNAKHIIGHGNRSAAQMLQNAQQLSTSTHTYTKAKTKTNNTIYHQVNNDTIHFVPNYHKDTGLIMTPIPATIQKSIIGFYFYKANEFQNSGSFKGLIAF